MANYSVNVDLPGAKKVFTSEAAVSVGSSTVVPMFVVALDGANMAATIDGYLECQSNTDASQVIIQHTSALKANELVGNYVWVSLDGPEVRQIVSNTAAEASADSTLTVDRPFTDAPSTGDLCNIRLWEDFNIPVLFSSLQQFAEKFIDKDASGNYEWTDCENAFYTISEFLNNGGTLFYVVPVIEDSDADVLTERLGTGVTGNSTFQARALNLSPHPEVICVPKQPKLAATLTTTNWATVDAAWNTYISNRATSSTTDDELKEMVYISDSPTAVTATAVTYRTSDLNATTERMAMVHGQYMVPSLTKGQFQAVAASPAYCGVINRVSTGAPESFGHAFDGANYTQVAHRGLVEKDITPANRISLIGNAVNPLVVKSGRGSWFESQFTQAKAITDTGSDPLEHLHVVLGRAKIWNSVQPILASAISEPNTAVVRQGVKSRIDSYMSQLVRQNIIGGFTLADVSSSADVTSGIARFELKVFFNREIDFVELKLTAALGG